MHPLPQAIFSSIVVTYNLGGQILTGYFVEQVTQITYIVQTNGAQTLITLAQSQNDVSPLQPGYGAVYAQDSSGNVYLVTKLAYYIVYSSAGDALMVNNISFIASPSLVNTILDFSSSADSAQMILFF